MLYALLAQAADGPPGPQVPFLLRPEVMAGLAVLFIVTVILPQNRRQRKEQEQLATALKPGARVVTASGIIGTIVKVKDGEDEVTLRSEDAKLKVLKSSVTRVLGADEADAKN